MVRVAPPHRHRYGFDPAAVRGFTLVELLVTMVVAAVLMSLAAPSMRSFLVRRAVMGQAEALASSLRFARSEALKTGVPVSMCVSADPAAAAPSCSGASDWATGWFVYIDRANVGDYSTADRDQIQRVQQVIGNVGAIGGTRSRVSYNPNGIARTDATTFVVRPVGYASGDPEYDAYASTVCMSKPGRVRVLAGSKAC